MALSSLPYKIRITSVVPDAQNLNYQLFFDILNSANSVLASSTCWIGVDESYSEIHTMLSEQVFAQMESDAGSRLALLQAIVNKPITIS